METAEAPDAATYMREAASTAQGRTYKEYLLRGLDVRPAQTVLDVGCGPGTDLPALATAVGPSGSVIGVDVDPAMVAHAHASAVAASVEVRVGDAHALPVDDATVDRARIDRMMQHVRDPGLVMAELRRVTRPGALVALAEPDWATLVIDSDDQATADAYVGFVCSDVVRNPRVGRALARLAHGAGFEVRSVQPFAPFFDDFAAADRFLGVGRVSERAIRAGAIDQTDGRRWLDALAHQPFLATVMLFTVIAEAPPLRS